MKIQRLFIVLTLVNLALLIFMLAQMHPATAQAVGLSLARIRKTPT